MATHRRQRLCKVWKRDQERFYGEGDLRNGPRRTSSFLTSGRGNKGIPERGNDKSQDMKVEKIKGHV